MKYKLETVTKKAFYGESQCSDVLELRDKHLRGPWFIGTGTTIKRRELDVDVDWMLGTSVDWKLRTYNQKDFAIPIGRIDSIQMVEDDVLEEEDKK